MRRSRGFLFDSAQPEPLDQEARAFAFGAFACVAHASKLNHAALQFSGE
jgi:hypothetical protein